MKAFERRKRDRVRAEFEPAEAALLINLLGQIIELLRDRNGPEESSPDPLFAQLGTTGSSLPPEDPVLRRLLPDAYRDDDEAAGDFRRFTERGLSTAKVENAQAVVASLAAGGYDLEDPEQSEDPVEVELGERAVQAWLRALTDIRLALAVRLGIESEEDAEAAAESDDEAVSVVVDIYEWLGFVQESLVAALD
ncbi:DUF2017 domain-containing protein [Mumia zhuanghuii]|uniref:DUF2017 domain-containing protein n=1 Tax=Mumia zhuanghuii TaxID=2585211 RepID=A0A5C4MIF1_9ACTN|nr:DUF2017 domain-containing protein [Mumia zhuanghuii]TNC39878.1 DUF2017 domain-containing protein [Mumia zhuanghuii]TNC41796.1 DUF2017 domain-containing protein [Mumia zhuanghuii]